MDLKANPEEFGLIATATSNRVGSILSCLVAACRFSDQGGVALANKGNLR